MLIHITTWLFSSCHQCTVLSKRKKNVKWPENCFLEWLKSHYKAISAWWSLQTEIFKNRAFKSQTLLQYQFKPQQQNKSTNTLNQIPNEQGWWVGLFRQSSAVSGRWLASERTLMPGYWPKNTHKVHKTLLAEEKRRRRAWSQKAWLLRLWVGSILGGGGE